MDISILEEWVNINSGTHNSEGLRGMAIALEKRLKPMPGIVERIPLDSVTELDGTIFHPGDAIRFKFNPKSPVQVLFSGHMDTVYGPESPFQKLRDLGDGRVNGPGVADMKGGLFILIEAVDAFLAADTSGNLGGEILITADEEIGSPASHDLIYESAQRHNLGLVYESTLPKGELVCERRGTGTFRVTAKGRSAHTGRDFASGKNAIVALSQLIVRLHAINGTIPDGILNVGRISGGGATNVVPETAETWINVRSGTVEGAEALEAAVRESLASENAAGHGVRLELTGAFTRLPKIESKGDAILHGLWNDVEQEQGLSISGKMKSGGSSDGNILGTVGLPHLDGIGIKGGAIHSDEEFAIISSIPEQISRSKSLLDKIAQNPGQFSQPPFKVTL